jgi:hypothetical protein
LRHGSFVSFDSFTFFASFSRLPSAAAPSKVDFSGSAGKPADGLRLEEAVGGLTVTSNPNPWSPCVQTSDASDRASNHQSLVMLIIKHEVTERMG